MPTFDEYPDLPRMTEFTTLDSLHAAMRRRVPQVIAAITETQPDSGERCLVVTYRGRGPWRLVEDVDAEVIRWYDGPAQGLPIGFINDIDTTADAIGSMMGAAVRGNPEAPF